MKYSSKYGSKVRKSIKNAVENLRLHTMTLSFVEFHLYEIYAIIVPMTAFKKPDHKNDLIYSEHKSLSLFILALLFSVDV